MELPTLYETAKNGSMQTILSLLDSDFLTWKTSIYSESGMWRYRTDGTKLCLEVAEVSEEYLAPLLGTYELNEADIIDFMSIFSECGVPTAMECRQMFHEMYTRFGDSWVHSDLSEAIDCCE